MVRIQDLLNQARRGERTLVMGILNITPDSFSDGGLFLGLDEAIRAAWQMARDGADILDVGGESTRPGANAVSVDEELDRVMPVIRALAERVDTPLSVDTYKAEVASRAVQEGASMINDVSAMTSDRDMAVTLARLRVPVCLMDRGGANAPWGDGVGGVDDVDVVDVVKQVSMWLSGRGAAARAAGIADENIILDPGFGFGKTTGQNLEIIRRLREFMTLGYPLLLGTSRKGTIGKVLGGLPVSERLEGSAATVALSIANGASIVRVHDVKAMVRVARMTDAIVRGRWREPERT